jgi:hypothetical protein
MREIASPADGMDREPTANEPAFADQSLSTPWTRGMKVDWDEQTKEVRLIQTAIEAVMPGGYDALVIDTHKLDDDLLRPLCGYLNADYFEARSLASRVLEGLAAAVHKTDWRLGYGKVRPDATVPEVAAKLTIAAVELLAEAFSSRGMTAYRNKHHAFIEAMAEFAEQANGGLRSHMTFYQRLGERVAREVLGHNLASPRPMLTPAGVDYEAIETVALAQLVYFVQVGEAGAIKIGIARDPASRLASLQTGHHEDLHIRALTHGGAEQERAYHEQFAAHRLRGEWFAPHPDILAEIERLSK